MKKIFPVLLAVLAFLPATVRSQQLSLSDPFGIRVSSSFAFFNLADLNSNQANLQYHYRQIQNATYQYQFSSTSVSNAPIFEVNPFLALNPDLEVGLAFDYWAFSPLDLDVSDNYPGYLHNYQHNLNSFEIDVKVRFYVVNSEGNEIRFFLEPGAGIQPINYQLQENYQNTGNTPPNNQLGDNANATAFDASLLAGVVFALSPGASFSVGVGYQSSYATNFSGTFNDAEDPAKNGVPGTIRFYNIPNSGPPYILFTPSNPAQLSLFNITPTMVADSRPLVVDLSGLRFTADLTWTF